MASNPPPAPVLYVLGLAFTAVGSFSLWRGFRRRRAGTEMERRERTDIAAIRPGRDDDLVEVAGTAEPTDAGTVDAPVAGTEGMIVDTEVGEWRSQDPAGEDPDEGNWESVTVHSERQSRPFLIDDGTGRAVVDPPANAETRTTGGRVEVEPGTEPPERVRRILDKMEDIDPAPGNHRIYSQGVIEPGEEVYVVAAATRADGDWGGPAVELTGDRRPGEVLISDVPEEELAAGEKRMGLLTMVLSTLFLAAGLLLLISPLAFL